MVTASSRQKQPTKARSETAHLFEADRFESPYEEFDLGENERLEVLEESAGSYVEDHARSEESGWYYSDED